MSSKAKEHCLKDDSSYDVEKTLPWFCSLCRSFCSSKSSAKEVWPNCPLTLQKEETNQKCVKCTYSGSILHMLETNSKNHWVFYRNPQKQLTGCLCMFSSIRKNKGKFLSVTESDKVQLTKKRRPFPVQGNAVQKSICFEIVPNIENNSFKIKHHESDAFLGEDVRRRVTLTGKDKAINWILQSFPNQIQVMFWKRIIHTEVGFQVRAIDWLTTIAKAFLTSSKGHKVL